VAQERMRLVMGLTVVGAALLACGVILVLVGSTLHLKSPHDGGEFVHGGEAVAICGLAFGVGVLVMLIMDLADRAGRGGPGKARKGLGPQPAAEGLTPLPSPETGQADLRQEPVVEFRLAPRYARPDHADNLSPPDAGNGPYPYPAQQAGGSWSPGPAYAWSPRDDWDNNAEGAWGPPGQGDWSQGGHQDQQEWAAAAQGGWDQDGWGSPGPDGWGQGGQQQWAPDGRGGWVRAGQGGWSPPGPGDWDQGGQQDQPEWAGAGQQDVGSGGVPGWPGVGQEGLTSSGMPGWAAGGQGDLNSGGVPGWAPAAEGGWVAGAEHDWPAAEPAASRGGPRDAPRTAPSEPAPDAAATKSAESADTGAFDDTAPIPVIRDAGPPVPKTAEDEPARGPEPKKSVFEPAPKKSVFEPGPKKAPERDRDDAGRRATADALPAETRAKLEQIKDLYLTAEAIGEDALVKHFDQLSQRQRSLIREFFEQSGLGSNRKSPPSGDSTQDGASLPG
jgi:hypothetical protein